MAKGKSGGSRYQHANSKGTQNPGKTKIVTGSTSSHKKIPVQSKLRQRNQEPC